MHIRSTIVSELEQLFEEEEFELPEFRDDLVLLETDLDSLGFAILVTRLEERLGYDPFSLMDDAVYPATLKDFVDIYAKFAPDSQPAK